MPAPALFWWHLTQELSEDELFDRARAVMASGFEGGSLDTGERKARIVTDSWRALMKFLPQGGDRFLTIIIVAGHDGDTTRGVMEELRDGMRLGVLD
jgi:hypothetical protein